MALEAVGSSPITHPKRRKAPPRGGFSFFSWAWVVRTQTPLRPLHFPSPMPLARKGKNAASRKRWCRQGTKVFFLARTEGEQSRAPITHPIAKAGTQTGTCFCLSKPQAWYLTTRSVYIIAAGVYHQPQAVFFCGLMRYKAFALMISTALP